MYVCSLLTNTTLNQLISQNNVGLLMAYAGIGTPHSKQSMPVVACLPQEKVGNVTSVSGSRYTDNDLLSCLRVLITQVIKCTPSSLSYQS